MLILLDRDGTLIEEGEYLTDPRKVKLLPGVIPSLKRLQRSGCRAVVVSNQSGVGRGIISRAQLKKVNARFEFLLEQKGVQLDGFYWCPHAPRVRCACRKPKLGLVKRAARDLRLSWRGAISVGDRPSDVRLGQRCQGRGILVLTGYGRKWAGKSHQARPDYVARNLNVAVDWILKQERKDRHDP